jgi:hypothetical protein
MDRQISTPPGKEFIIEQEWRDHSPPDQIIRTSNALWEEVEQTINYMSEFPSDPIGMLNDSQLGNSYSQYVKPAPDLAC